MSSKGFVRFPNHALSDERLSGLDLLVLLAIASFSNSKTKAAFPSQSSIALRARCARQTANRSVRRLEQFGYIRVERRRRRNGSQSSNRYVILDDSARARGSASTATAGSVSRATPNREQDLSNNCGCHDDHVGKDGIADCKVRDALGDAVDPRYQGPKMPLDMDGVRELRRLERELLGEAKYRALFAALRRKGCTVIAPDRSHMRRLYDEFAPLLRAEGATEIVVSISNDKCRL